MANILLKLYFILLLDNKCTQLYSGSTVGEAIGQFTELPESFRVEKF